MPPANVEVPEPTENMRPGVEEPMPTFPVFNIVNSVVVAEGVELATVNRGTFPSERPARLLIAKKEPGVEEPNPKLLLVSFQYRLPAPPMALPPLLYCICPSDPAALATAVMKSQITPPDVLVVSALLVLHEGKLIRRSFANIPPVKVDVPVPVSVICPLTNILPAVNIFPVVSKTPSVVVAVPTPRPPERKRSDVAPFLPIATSPGLSK